MHQTHALVLAGALLLGACAHTEVRQHAAVDTAHKTISVPPHKRGLMNSVVKELVAAGWKVAVDPAAAQPSAKPQKPPARNATAENKPATAPSRPAAATRYRMTANYRDIDYCRGGRIYIYEFAIIDNESGAKILEIGGRECDRDAIAKFRAAIAPRS